MSFDLIPGSSQYLTCAQAPYKDIGTITGWFAPDFASTTTSNYTFWDAATGKVALRTSGTASVLTCEVDGRLSTKTIPTAWTTGTWHHFAMVYSKTADLIDLYIDGVLCAAAAAKSGTWGANTPGTMYFGATATPNNYFDGKVAEIAYYNKVLGSEEIGDLVNLKSPFLVARPNIVWYAPLISQRFPRIGEVIAVRGATPLTNASHPGILDYGGYAQDLKQPYVGGQWKEFLPWYLGIESVDMTAAGTTYYWSNLIPITGFNQFLFSYMSIAPSAGASGAAEIRAQLYASDGCTKLGPVLQLGTAINSYAVLTRALVASGNGFAANATGATVNAMSDLLRCGAGFMKVAIYIATLANVESWGALSLWMRT